MQIIKEIKLSKQKVEIIKKTFNNVLGEEISGVEEIIFKKNEFGKNVARIVYKNEPIEVYIDDDLSIDNELSQRMFKNALTKLFNIVKGTKGLGTYSFSDILPYLRTGMPVRNVNWDPRTYIKRVMIAEGDKKGLIIAQFVEDSLFDYACNLNLDLEETWEIYAKG